MFSPDRRVSLAAALFYNDYKDYIGLNTILATPPTFDHRPQFRRRQATALSEGVFRFTCTMGR